MARLPGVRRAPPRPCTNRAPMSASAVGATAHSSDATVNTPVPIWKMRRRPLRSPSEPPSRMSEASVSRYPLRIHCRELVEACRSSPILGTATLTTVPSRNAIPDPRTATASTQRPARLPKATSSTSDGQEVEQRRVDFLGVRPGDVVRTAFHGDQLQVLDEARQA